MNYNFENKIALVTEGTSRIGKEIAKKEFEEYKDKVLFIKADISN